jgi:hypothetical protein
MRPTVPPVGVEYGCQGSRPCAKSLVVGGGQVLENPPQAARVCQGRTEAGNLVNPHHLPQTFYKAERLAVANNCPLVWAARRRRWRAEFQFI